ncbi:hypothetical protein L1887_42873 [Cichorium endivia]|nr:hypothetical protein L1887_42873 [Cichorium endivia]
MLCVTLSYVLFDNATTHDTADRHYRLPALLEIIPYLQLPAALLALFTLVWQAAPGDLLGFGAWLSALTGHNIMALHNLTLPELLLAAASTGYTMSTNTVVAHELIHKTHSLMAMMVGRWLLALVGDAQFSISHVYSHHPNVATPADGATARRGENVYRFFIRSSLSQYVESWQVEAQRLSLQNRRGAMLVNRVISGVLMSLLIVAACFTAAGIRGALACLVTMLVSKFLFETVNYIQHYGLVRLPGTRVEPRHSWDCNNRASSAGLLNLTRHSDHHTHPRREYWNLQAHSYAVGIEKGEQFDRLIEQAYQQYRGPAYLRSPMVSCVKAGIRLMDWVVPGATADWLGNRFFTPRRVPTRASDKEMTALASRIESLPLSNGKHAVVYRWGSEGPTVLLAHGWESRASHFGRLIKALVEKGFQVIGFDAPAHGNAAGCQSSIVEFIEIIEQLAQQDGGFDAIVAHSFGGLSVINAVKAGLRTRALVIVGAPTHFSGLVTKYAAILNLPGRQQQRLRRYIEGYFGIGEAVWQRFNAYEGLQQVDQMPGQRLAWREAGRDPRPGA